MAALYSDTTQLESHGIELERRPSAASRWMACPGSVWVSAVLPEPPSSFPAAEGTLAHWVLSTMGQAPNTRTHPEELISLYKCAADEADNEFDVRVTDEMVALAQSAHSELENFSGFVLGGGKSCYEQGVKFKSPEAEIEGTADYVAWDADTIILVDYKFGKKFVNSRGNCQLGTYACAVRQLLGRKRIYYLGILQPRTGNYRGIRWWVLTDKDLDKFELNLREAITRTKLFPAVYRTGEHCHFCPGKFSCPAKCADHISALVAAKTKGELFGDPLGLWVLSHEKELIGGISKLREEAETHAKSGNRVAGYELKEHLGNRKWIPNVLDELEGRASVLQINRETVKRETVKPITITEAEKLGIDTEGLTERAKTMKLVESKSTDSLKGF